jgi:hypothetical protein
VTPAECARKAEWALEHDKVDAAAAWAALGQLLLAIDTSGPVRAAYAVALAAERFFVEPDEDAFGAVSAALDAWTEQTRR